VELEKLLAFAAQEKLTESELLRAAQKLKHILTQDRSQLLNYTEDDQLVAAYVVFYFSSNLAKWNLIDLIDYPLKDRYLKANILDFGCGPGTYSYAFLNWNNQFGGKLFAIDRSSKMRQVANRILRSQATVQSSLPKDVIDLMIFGNSMNEMELEESLSMINKVNPTDLLLIEPGDKITFHKSLALRTHLIELGYNIIYPCSANLACPLSATTDWCHQYAIHSPDISVERLNQKLNWDRRRLPLLFHFYSKELVTQNKKTIVRSPPKKKFGKDLKLCTLKDDKIEITDYRINKTDLKKLNDFNLLEGQLIK
jgi:ribosomal protein RSM22 (predicted rRNA methylase)